MEPIEIGSIETWRHWLQTNCSEQEDVWVMIFKKASGRQVVTFDDLLEEALCWGWVDTQTRGIDDVRYSIRFRKRRPRSNWSVTNRAIVARLLAERRLQPAGIATLPDDIRSSVK